MIATFELVQLRAPEGLILYLKHQASPWTFRVLPVRDPDQPRLWCLRVEPCAGPSLSARTAMVDPFYTCLGMLRGQLGDTLDAIRRDARIWVAEEAHPAFRNWLDQITGMPIPEDFVPPEPPVRRSRIIPPPRPIGDGSLGASPDDPDR